MRKMKGLVLLFVVVIATCHETSGQGTYNYVTCMLMCQFSVKVFSWRETSRETHLQRD